LKSGEAYETRVKQAKGKAVHPEHFASPVAVGIVIAAAVFLFAGLKWQETCEEGMSQRPDLFGYTTEQMQAADDLVSQGRAALAAGDRDAASTAFEEARTNLEALITWLDQTSEAIQPDETEILTGQPRDQGPFRRNSEPQYDKRVVKRMLVNLLRKAERKFDQVPSV
jgi:hypothetical protein